jgi:hypothetical protein
LRVPGVVLPYTLGALVTSGFESQRRVGHPGDIHGFSAQYSYYLDDDLTIVILTNTQSALFPPIAIEQKIVRVLFGLPLPEIKDLALPPETATSLVGEYGDLRFGFDRIAFVSKDRTLQMELGGEGAPAVALRYQAHTVQPTLPASDFKPKAKVTTRVESVRSDHLVTTSTISASVSAKIVSLGSLYAAIPSPTSSRWPFTVTTPNAGAR